MTNTAFSVFASSHYVPTTLMSLGNNTYRNDTLLATLNSSSNITSFGKYIKVFFLGEHSKLNRFIQEQIQLNF
jgi:uncharacterized protein with von Willebrand factor type A (vWA) domain